MMKPLKINDLPPDIVTGVFKFKYEYLSSGYYHKATYDDDLFLMLQHLKNDTILVKYERIGPAPVNLEMVEILERLNGIEKTLTDALQVTT